MAYLEEKNGAADTTSPISQNEPLPVTSQTTGFASLADFEKKDMVSSFNVVTPICHFFDLSIP
jgi:hypothetical protein